MDALKIVTVTEKDLNALKDICVQTFSETYRHLNTEANFNKYIQTNFNKEKLLNEINDENSLIYFIKEKDNNIGYLKLNINEAQSENFGNNAMEIERVYTLKEHFGKNAGKRMIEFTIEKGKELKKEFVWLGVWENNARAIAFYEKHGFTKFDTHVFNLGNDEQVDHLYKLEITK
ncbi:MAG: GNAT family N-acetyltransferase [Bacteroidetes bacterium]|nr:GNAT family N-acetyltransferase [Bacteroidota bacterium]